MVGYCAFLFASSSNHISWEPNSFFKASLKESWLYAYYSYFFHLKFCLLAYSLSLDHNAHFTF